MFVLSQARQKTCRRHVRRLSSRDCDPSKEMVVVVCKKCSETGMEALTAKVTDALRNGIWPELREIRMTHEFGGRA